jgi:hypothetical protein
MLSNTHHGICRPQILLGNVTPLTASVSTSYISNSAETSDEFDLVTATHSDHRYELMLIAMPEGVKFGLPGHRICGRHPRVL